MDQHRSAPQEFYIGDDASDVERRGHPALPSDPLVAPLDDEISAPGSTGGSTGGRAEQREATIPWESRACRTQGAARRSCAPVEEADDRKLQGRWLSSWGPRAFSGGHVGSYASADVAEADARDMAPEIWDPDMVALQRTDDETALGQEAWKSEGGWHEAAARSAGSGTSSPWRQRWQVEISSTKLHVTGLPFDTTSAELEELFGSIGDVVFCATFTDRSGSGHETRFGRWCQCTGKVEFATADMALRAMSMLDGSWFRDRRICICVLAEEPTERVPTAVAVSNLCFDTTAVRLLGFFQNRSSCEVLDAAVLSDLQTGRSKGTGKVLCAGPESARHAAWALDGAWLDGRCIEVRPVETSEAGGAGVAAAPLGDERRRRRDDDELLR